MANPFQNPLLVEEIPSPQIDRLLQSWSPLDPGFLLESGLDVAGTGRWSFWGGFPIGHFTRSPSVTEAESPADQ